jgi:hypothetical protein
MSAANVSLIYINHLIMFASKAICLSLSRYKLNQFSMVQREGKEISEELEHMPTFIKNLTEQLNFHYNKISAMTNILTSPPPPAPQMPDQYFGTSHDSFYSVSTGSSCSVHENFLIMYDLNTLPSSISSHLESTVS